MVCGHFLGLEGCVVSQKLSSLNYPPFPTILKMNLVHRDIMRTSVTWKRGIKILISITISYEAIVLILIFNYLDGLDSPVP